MADTTVTIATSAFIQNLDGKFLFVKRSDDDSFLPGFWEMPGGKMESGETLLDAVTRETREEVGLIIEPLNILAFRNYPHETDKKRQFIELFFNTKPINRDQSVKLSFEHSDFAWISFGEANSMHTTPYLLQVLGEIESKI